MKGITIIALFFLSSVCQAQWQLIDPLGDAIVRSDGGFIRMGCQKKQHDPDDQGVLTMTIYEPRAEWVPGQETTVEFRTPTGSFDGNTGVVAITTHMATVVPGHVLFEFAKIKYAEKSFLLRGPNFERAYSAENFLASLLPALKKCEFGPPWTDP